MYRISASSLIAVTLGSLLAIAVPTPDNIALARKYAPQWRFQSSEIYWPSTVEYFLAGVKQADANGKIINEAVTTSNVDDAPNQGSGLFLTTDINSGKGGFLRGQNPANTATSVYTFIAPKANGVVDLFYWLFTPFNQGKSVPLIGQVGDHVGDWERMTVRTVNGVATQVDYHAHGDTGSGTIPWSQVKKFDNDQRPVGYIAKGSHGFWATAGTFTYVNAVVFQLQDVTSDGGVAWDTRDSLVMLSYPDTFSGTLDWLNYKGFWGNPGQTDCWWYIFHNECEIVTGPDGPLRDDVLGAAKSSAISPARTNMNGPLSQTLGIVSKSGASSYTLYIDNSIRTSALRAALPQLAVQQTCTSPIESGGNKSNSTISKDQTPLTSTTLATTSLTENSNYTFTPKACDAHTTVTSYVIGLCAGNTAEDCIWSTSRRTLRAYSLDPSISGPQLATAIVVTDLDVWKW